MIQKTVKMWLCRKKHKPRWVWPQTHHVTKVTNQIPDVRLWCSSETLEILSSCSQKQLFILF